MRMIRRAVTAGMVLCGLSLLAGPGRAGAAAPDVTVYTTRDAALTRPVLDSYTRLTGRGVALVRFPTLAELTERLAQDQAAGTPSADLAIIPDIAGLFDLVNRKAVQPVSSAVVDQAVPASLRHPSGMWFALSYRVRAIVASRDRVAEPLKTYRDMTDPRLVGRVCVSAGTLPANTALFSAMLMREGESQTGFFLQSLKRNLARQPDASDLDVVRDIATGGCDLGMANTSQMGLMLSGGAGPQQARWAEAVRVMLPVFADGGGSHVDITGASVLRNALNPVGAIALLEYLVSEDAQKAFAAAGFEYPVHAGVPVAPVLAGFGTPSPDTTSLSGIAVMLPAVPALLARVEFDRAVPLAAASPSQVAVPAAAPVAPPPAERPSFFRSLFGR